MSSRLVYLWFVVAFVIGGLAVERAQAQGGQPDAYTKLPALLRKVADTNLDPGVQVAQIVRTTRQTANRVAMGGSVDTDQPVFLVVMRGSFVATKARVPYDEPDPTGSVIALVVDAASGKIWDFGLGNKMPALETLGAVQTLTF